MDIVLNVKSVTSALLVLILTLNTVYSNEQFDGNMAVSNVTTNGLKTSLNRTESVGKMSGSKVLSRRKRYVAFPEGSSFSVSLVANSICIYTVLSFPLIHSKRMF